MSNKTNLLLSITSISLLILLIIQQGFIFTLAQYQPRQVLGENAATICLCASLFGPVDPDDYFNPIDMVGTIDPEALEYRKEAEKIVDSLLTEINEEKIKTADQMKARFNELIEQSFRGEPGESGKRAVLKRNVESVLLERQKDFDNTIKKMIVRESRRLKTAYSELTQQEYNRVWSKYRNRIGNIEKIINKFVAEGIPIEEITYFKQELNKVKQLPTISERFTAADFLRNQMEHLESSYIGSARAIKNVGLRPSKNLALSDIYKSISAIEKSGFTGNSLPKYLRQEAQAFSKNPNQFRGLAALIRLKNSLLNTALEFQSIKLAYDHSILQIQGGIFLHNRDLAGFSLKELKRHIRKEGSNFYEEYKGILRDVYSERREALLLEKLFLEPEEVLAKSKAETSLKTLYRKNPSQFLRSGIFGLCLPLIAAGAFISDPNLIDPTKKDVEAAKEGIETGQFSSDE